MPAVVVGEAGRDFPTSVSFFHTSVNLLLSSPRSVVIPHFCYGFSSWIPSCPRLSWLERSMICWEHSETSWACAGQNLYSLPVWAPDFWREFLNYKDENSFHIEKTSSLPGKHIDGWSWMELHFLQCWLIARLLSLSCVSHIFSCSHCANWSFEGQKNVTRQWLLSTYFLMAAK